MANAKEESTSKSFPAATASAMAVAYHKQKGKLGAVAEEIREYSDDDGTGFDPNLDCNLTPAHPACASGTSGWNYEQGPNSEFNFDSGVNRVGSGRTVSDDDFGAEVDVADRKPNLEGIRMKFLIFLIIINQGSLEMHRCQEQS